MLELKDVSAFTKKGRKILEKISLKFPPDTLTLVLGPNAAGKTTLGEVISGSNDIKVKGEVVFENKKITKKTLDERARLGIFLVYQSPVEIPGVKIFDFLFASYKSVVKKDICVWDFHELLLQYLLVLKLPESFLQRNINEGFSGGEKKKFEILQMLVLKPKVVVLDEIDSGLDVDSIKDIFKIIRNYQKEQKATLILISHASEILKYINPDKVIVLKNMTVKEQGGVQLAKKILKKGYE